MINFAIPETRYTRRVWVYVAWRHRCIIGRHAFVEFIEAGGEILHFSLY